jgi:hypothetical protein
MFKINNLRKNIFNLLLFLVTAAFIAGCYKYIQLQIEIEYEKISPPYVLQIENTTGKKLILLPNASGISQGFEGIPIEPGESARILLRVRKFKVSPDDHTGSNEIVTDPYIENAGARTAVIKFKSNRIYKFRIDLNSEKWFSQVETSEAAPKVLKVTLKDFTKQRWFIGGPNNP